MFFFFTTRRSDCRYRQLIRQYWARTINSGQLNPKFSPQTHTQASKFGHLQFYCFGMCLSPPHSLPPKYFNWVMDKHIYVKPLIWCIRDSCLIHVSSNIRAQFIVFLLLRVEIRLKSRLTNLKNRNSIKPAPGISSFKLTHMKDNREPIFKGFENTIT